MNIKDPILRVGVIGVGTMGRHHVRILSQTDGVQMAGLYDPDAARAEELCSRHGCESTADLDKLLDRCDAVSIAAPTSLHAEIGARCIERGIHVLMEKPLAHDVRSAAALVESARRAGLTLAVGHVERYNPAIGKLMELLSDPQEEIVSIDIRRLAPFDGTRCMDVDVLYDLLIHDIDLALEIANSEIEAVSASGRPVYSQQTDAVHVRVDFKNRCTAVFWAAKCSPRRVRLITVTTPRRYLEADTLSKTLTVHTAEAVPHVVEGVCFMGDLRREEVPVPDEEPLRRELDDFIRAVRERRPPVVDGARALKALVALQLVADSMGRAG